MRRKPLKGLTRVTGSLTCKVVLFVRRERSRHLGRISRLLEVQGVVSKGSLVKVLCLSPSVTFRCHPAGDDLNDSFRKAVLLYPLSRHRTWPMQHGLDAPDHHHAITPSRHHAITPSRHQHADLDCVGHSPFASSGVCGGCVCGAARAGRQLRRKREG